ncbi:hypothetical protein KC960_01425 [Candidatus Saccharibacteria bacterium]|nr:hypothetical protein [Candidatus Saccharibacteria bacterium]
MSNSEFYLRNYVGPLISGSCEGCEFFRKPVEDGRDCARSCEVVIEAIPKNRRKGISEGVMDEAIAYYREIAEDCVRLLIHSYGSQESFTPGQTFTNEDVRQRLRPLDS